MQEIRMSQPFFDLLKKLTMVSKSKETVFFKSGGRCRVSVPTTATFLHVSAGPGDMDFDGDEVCVASLMEFIRFCELVGFPGNGSVSVSDETLTNGHVYPMIKFKNGTEKTATKTARTICADPTRFDAKARKVPVDRAADPLPLVATIALDREELKVMNNELKLVPGCQFVSIVVAKNRVKIYMKGRTGQQITNDIPPNCTKFGAVDAIAAAYGPNVKNKYRKVPALYFTILKGIEADYEVEIRHTGAVAKVDKIAIKGFTNIPGVDPNDPISLYLGGVESDGAEINAESLVE